MGSVRLKPETSNFHLGSGSDSGCGLLQEALFQIIFLNAT